MPRRPAYLAEFADEDAAWFVRHGEERRVRPGEVVIEEKVTPEHVFIVLRGKFVVSSRSLGVLDIQRIGRGEILGEMSYLNREPPGGSVIAHTNGVLLAVRRGDIDARIRVDPAFADRFHRVASNFANSRLWRFVRRRLTADRSDEPDPPSPDPPDPPRPEPDPKRVDEILRYIEIMLEGGDLPEPEP